MRGQAREQWMGVSETKKSNLCLEWQDTARCAIAKGFPFLVGPVTSEECLHISEHHRFICKKETRTSASPQITSASPPINHFDPVVGRNRETGTHMANGGQSGHLFLFLSLFNLTHLQSTCARHYNSHFTNINLLSFCGGLQNVGNESPDCTLVLGDSPPPQTRSLAVTLALVSGTTANVT